MMINREKRRIKTQRVWFIIGEKMTIVLILQIRRTRVLNTISDD